MVQEHQCDRTASPHRQTSALGPEYLYLAGLGISIWLNNPAWSGGSLPMIEEGPSAPSGDAPASPDLIFGTALTPQRKSSGAS